MKRNLSSKSMQNYMREQNIQDNDGIGDEVLEQLCNPNSVNLQQSKDNVLIFGQVLAKESIIERSKFKEVQDIIFKKIKIHQELTQQQTINLLKWELIFQFFSYCTNTLSQQQTYLEKSFISNSVKKQRFQEIYNSQVKQCLNGLKQKNSLKETRIMSNKNIVSKNVLQYVSFQIITCILELKTILQNKYNDQEEHENSQQEESHFQKIFYFIDIGQVLEITHLWTEIQVQFKKEIIIEKLSYPISNKKLLKYLYLGLIVESLDFQSVSSSLRFAGELLWLLLNDIQSVKSELDSFRNQFFLIFHLNKVVYFLRILKKNHAGAPFFHGNSQDHVSNAQSSSMNSQSVIQSKRSLLSKGLGSSNKIQIVHPSQKSLQTNHLDEESVFLNLLQQKTQKIIYKFTNKYKDFNQKLNQIKTLYEPLNQMLTAKLSSGHGSQHHTNYSLNSFKKFKSVKFNEDQKNKFFTSMSRQLKVLFKKMQFRPQQMFFKAKNIFIQTEINEKLKSKLESQQNKKFKTELMKQFNKHLISNQKLTQSQSKFNGQSKQKSFSQVIKKQNKISNNVYFPSLKPKINIQIENRLKLKQIRTSQPKQLKNQSFFSTNKDKKQLIKQKSSQILQNNIKIGPVIRSKKNIYNSSQSLQKIKDKKSISLPSKVKISTNYDIKSRFDKINFYESTKNSIMNRKFSYQMIVCKRKKSTGQQLNLFENNQLLIGNNQLKNQKQKLIIKKDAVLPSKIIQKKNSLKASTPDIKNSRRRQSVILNSSASARKLALNQKDFIIEQKNQQSGSKLNSALNKHKQSPSQQNIFVQCINSIVQSYKDPNKSNCQKRMLKLDYKLSLNKKRKNTHNYQDNSIISQNQQFNMSTLKFEDASQILTSLQVYLRGYLQYQRHNKIVQKYYPFYQQLQRMKFYKESQENLAFFDLAFKVKRQDFIKKTFEKEKQNYWSVFRLYLEINEKIYVIDIDQKTLFLQKISLRDCLKTEIQNKFQIYQFTSSKKFNKDYKYYMLGDLGGKLQHYIIKTIQYNPNQYNQQKTMQLYKEFKQQNGKNLLLQAYYQNPNLSQIVGIKRQKNTVDIIQLYVTQPFMYKNQLKPIPNFVKTLIFDPLNQYIIDWANNSIPKAQEIYQQMDRTVKVYQNRDRKIYHIYFLNRSYERRSKFKDIIKSRETKYPSFSFKQFRNSAFFLSQEEKDFSDCVEVIEFISKNLIINKKYVFFNIKILRIINQKDYKDYLMIEQNNSNFSDHRLIFFVFPLMIQNFTLHQENLKSRRPSMDKNQFVKDIQRRYYKFLMNKIRKQSYLNNLSRFLISKKMIEISDWPDTIFNKLLLIHPHVTIIKKAYFQDQGIFQGQKQQMTEGIKQKNRNLNTKKSYIFATIKIFILNNNNLVIGVIQIPGQSFFFNCLFEQLNKKRTRFKCIPLSRNGFFQKRRTQQSLINGKRSQTFDLIFQPLDKNPKSRVSGQLKLSIKKIINQDEDHSLNENKTPIKRFSTMNNLKKQNKKMTGEQKISDIKQKFISIFKYDGELSVRLNIKKTKENEQKRMTMDNYQSLYQLSFFLSGEQVRLTQTKYYWWDVVPQTGQRCINFRLKDDSLSLIKFSKQNFYMRKSNKIKIHYFQNYLKLVSQNKLRYKGNAMNYIIRNQDKLIYYNSYKQFVQNLERYHYTFSSNYLLNQIRLFSKNNIYQVNTIDIDIDPNPGLTQSRRQNKTQHKSTHNFELNTSNLCSVHIQNLHLDKKLLNNPRFKKRLRSDLDHQLQLFLRKQC